MYISELKLWNFRKFGSDIFNLESPSLYTTFNQGLNVLVGENDSGKTCIIDAVKLLLKTYSDEWIKIEDEDFYKDSLHLRIECVFRGFEPNESRHFIQWLGMEKNNKDDPGTPLMRLILDVKRNNENKIFYYEVKAGCDDEGRQLSAEAKDFLKCTYLKPLRNAESELIPRKNSRLSQILYGHPDFEDKKDHDFIKWFKEVNEKLRKYFEEQNHEDEIRPVLNDALKKFLPRNSSQEAIFSTDRPELKKILEKLKLDIGSQQNSGLGTYNMLFIAVELLLLKRGNYDGIKLGLIEEIEAHLHPQAQLRVIQYLQDISEENKIQLIITTHSPNLASKVDLKNLIICRDNDAFPMNCDENEMTYLSKTDYSFLQRFLDVTKANLFFARGVILVEGDTENIIIPALAKLIGKDLSEYGVSIVNVGSTAFLRYANIFKRKDNRQMKVPVSIITDLDIRPDLYNTINSEAKTEKDFNINEKRKEKTNKYKGQSVHCYVSPRWTFEYCFALSQTLIEILFESIKSAGEEMTEDGYSGREIDKDLKTILNLNNTEHIAFEIYQNLMIKKQISKAITAQYFAKAIESKIGDNKFIDALKKDKSIKYLIDAINYVTPELL